jgi:hypothetical protein
MTATVTVHLFFCSGAFKKIKLFITGAALARHRASFFLIRNRLPMWSAHPVCGPMFSCGCRSSGLLCGRPHAACPMLCLWTGLPGCCLGLMNTSIAALVAHLAPAPATSQAPPREQWDRPRRCPPRRRFLICPSRFPYSVCRLVRPSSSSSAALPTHCVLPA